jgi:hypothetical protein
MIEQAELILSIGITVVLILFFVFVLEAILPTKSRKYAELLSDMFVVGTIKKLAKKEDIDLIKELQEFSRIQKKSDLSEKGLVSVVENELKEKVANVQEKDLKESKAK